MLVTSPPAHRSAIVGAALLAALATARVGLNAAAASVGVEPVDLEQALAGGAPLYVSDLVSLAHLAHASAVEILRGLK